MFTVVGQTAIPIPIVGALVGSMVGYALTSAFYGNLTTAIKEANIARENRIRIEEESKEAISMIQQYRAEMNAYIQRYFCHYNNIFNDALTQMDNALLGNDFDKFIEGANKITISFDGKVQFSNMSDFNSLMNSSKSLKL